MDDRVIQAFMKETKAQFDRITKFMQEVAKEIEDIEKRLAQIEKR